MGRNARIRTFVASVIVVGATVLVPVTSASAAPPPPTPSPCSGSTCWHPALNSRWQYQLQGVTAFASTGGINVNISGAPFPGGPAVRPSVFDIDLYVDPAIAGNGTTFNTAAVNAIHANGGRAICYVSAGTFEPWRPDAASYPDSIKGRAVSGFKDERWLDIRQTSILFPILDARVAKCAQAGFDGVEWDNVDGFSNRTGFPLTAADQLFYNASLANMAHAHGLTVALKNDVEQLTDLGPYFDYAINEQCQQYSECGGYATSFTGQGKAVFQVEYKLSLTKFCPQANAENRNAIKKTYDLFDMPWTACR
jgi:glycosyl hydrolase family 114